MHVDTANTHRPYHLLMRKAQREPKERIVLLPEKDTSCKRRICGILRPGRSRGALGNSKPYFDAHLRTDHPRWHWQEPGFDHAREDSNLRPVTDRVKTGHR